MKALSWTHPMAEVPERGLDIGRKANDGERARLAAALEILAIDNLTLSGRIVPRGAGHFRLDGRLHASVVQACVVSLDPIASRLDVPLAIDLVPAGEIAAAAVADDAADDPLAARLAEPIENGVVDLGDIVFQEMSAALDPYPRLPDAELERREATGDDPDAANPFAKLRALKPTPRE